MKHVFKKPHLFAVAGLLAFVIINSSWQIPKSYQQNSTANYSSNGDTDKPRLHNNDTYEFNMKGFDESMKELDKQMENLNIQLNKIDFDKINKQVNEALSKVDFDKISKNVEASLKKIDWDKIKVEVDNSLQNAKEELAKVNTEKIEEEMKDVQKKLNSEEFRSQFDSEKIHEKIDEAMNKAKAGIDKAKLELQNMKAFTDALQNDKLIDKSKAYKIQLKDGELYINGIKQSKEITEKYKKYYEGKSNFTINSDGKNDDND